MPVSEFILCTLAMFAGALVHGSVGLGMGLVAAPFLVLVEPRLVPAPLIVAGLSLATAMFIRERHAVDVTEIKWAVVGCVVGTAGATILLILIDPEAFGLVFGIALLLAVGMSLRNWQISPTPLIVFLAGSISGLMGTTTSVGGPPMALVYQQSEGARLRATLAAFFVAGGFIALTGLLVAGQTRVRRRSNSPCT